VVDEIVLAEQPDHGLGGPGVDRQVLRVML
jgi:hypothetical protein